MTPTAVTVDTLIKVLIAINGGSFLVIVGTGFKILKFLWTLNRFLVRSEMKIDLMWSDYQQRKGIIPEMENAHDEG